MNITDDIFNVGVNDHDIDLFEGQYTVPNGMAYNSYVIIDEKIAVLDTVDGNFSEKWLKNIETVLNGRTPDYLIIRPFCKYHEFHESISEYYYCRKCKDFRYDEKFL